MDADALVKQLAAGFDALQEEYQKLFGQHEALERKLATAREQYNELAKLCGSNNATTPPLSLSSSPAQKQELNRARGVSDILEQHEDGASRAVAAKIRAADKAALVLRAGLPRAADSSSEGVKIWAGPSADKQEMYGSSVMPSISESPLEQDFTIEGKPSRLGCPFASMAKKKLSSHAASVLSRYNQGGSAGAPSTPLSSVSRVNGRESLSRRGSRRASFVDPIKAEICGLSDHDEETGKHVEYAEEDRQEHDSTHNLPQSREANDVGVCPIRFLDQHSPEEVATYFEKHKHELPRSHETCVRRYQSNDQQIRELDAKYGNLVSMIQGLGEKHKKMLPDEPDDEAQENEHVIDEAKVRKWASSVSVEAEPPDGDRGDPGASQQEHGHDMADEKGEEQEERQQHFERSLRDVRVGESPSRPWGISVPAKYLDEYAGSTASSEPARVGPKTNVDEADPKVQSSHASRKPPGNTEVPAGRCPFGFDKSATVPRPSGSTKPPAETHAPELRDSARPAFVSAAPDDGAERPIEPGKAKASAQHVSGGGKNKMVFTGPVFVGFSAEDAVRILRETGLGGTT